MFVYLQTINQGNNLIKRFIMAVTKKYDARTERIASYAKALSHPARVAVMFFLASQDTCFFGDIEEVLPLQKATVSQHLSELKKVGLIQGEIQGQNTKYCINCEAWQEARELFDKFFVDCNKQTCGCED